MFILKQVCGSLREAHDSGLIHRDIKPRNSMLCVRGGEADFVKVLDFGLARSVRIEDAPGLTSRMQLVGTPLYIAPERIRDPTVIDPRSDIYSLGCVAYFLLTGRDVFSGATVLHILEYALHSPPPRPSDHVAGIPIELDQLVVECLAKDPQHRPQTVARVLERLDSVQCTGCWDAADARLWWEANTRGSPSSVAFSLAGASGQ